MLQCYHCTGTALTYRDLGLDLIERITGRVKDLFKSSKGKYVAPRQ